MCSSLSLVTSSLYHTILVNSWLWDIFSFLRTINFFEGEIFLIKNLLFKIKIIQLNIPANPRLYFILWGTSRRLSDKSTSWIARQAPPRPIGGPFGAFSRTLLARVPTLDPAKGLITLHSHQEEKI